MQATMTTTATTTLIDQMNHAGVPVGSSAHRAEQLLRSIGVRVSRRSITEALVEMSLAQVSTPKANGPSAAFLPLGMAEQADDDGDDDGLLVLDVTEQALNTIADQLEILAAVAQDTGDRAAFAGLVRLHAEYLIVSRALGMEIATTRQTINE